MFFPCTGLGRQQRGFETFTLECAAALRADPRVDLTVFSGGPVAEIPAHELSNIPRDSSAARFLSLLHRRGPYFSEQLTFFLNFLPHLRHHQPDVVYFADLNLGNLCWHWRRRSNATYRLLFYNGGLTTMPFTRTDLIQQLTPEGLVEATARGEDWDRQVVLPHGVNVPRRLPTPLDANARRTLGLPPDRKIVLSVGMLDNTIKRMLYVIQEVAALPEPRPFLVLLGAECDETATVRAAAVQILGADNVMIRTVPRIVIDSYYRAADVFILASLREGFGLAYVEALARGLPIVAHDFAVSRYLLDPYATFTDLTEKGAATLALANALRVPLSLAERQERHTSARSRFGWDVLKEKYVALLQRAARADMVIPA